MNVCKVFVPFGAMGTGISKDAFDGGIQLGPDIIACDAGSTDSGPYYLGTGLGKYARESVKEDLRMMVLAGHRLGVPVAVGSCGTCGSNIGVDDIAAMCAEICEEEGISLRVAKIYSEQNPEVLREKFNKGKITPLQAAPEITAKTFDECSHIVALAGAEPFIRALEEKADVILCGRATDTAIIAAMPILRGCDEAAAWHGAKIAECGALCCVDPMGGVFLTFDEEGVTVEATAPGNRCTAYSTSAHMLYENSDPFILTEPGVAVAVEHARYTEIEGTKVRITGASIEKKPYTMKLEGASPSGYQTVSLVGIADRRIMSDPWRWINSMKDHVQKRLDRIGLSGGYSYAFKPYGFNAVTGEDLAPGSFVPKEIGLIFIVTADTQELATKVAKVFNPMLLHYPVNQDEQLPSFAFPFSPAEIERGLIYEFRLNHVVHLADPLELVTIEYTDIGKRG
ncbi:acyclic terpene utilization AtuA family protein [Breznakiella homolactica]|uniref:Acyclic terpene utilization AtuA family protein n=1 Tax=Breznakiella homolactica TaxID=2798577 RepID=A0A7T8BB42_9SPIR|nr:acyclic terpene utilization AtuA family protein [Breznakiella homolactica]QQO10157.1 DUF1446 domain-containing protein [Breznakiella homolactica]